MYKEIEGDLIELAIKGNFDLIAHGCNCFCTQKAGIARKISSTFKTDEYFLEHISHSGDVNKLGQVEGYRMPFGNLVVVNAYTQYDLGANADYSALTVCLRKINHLYLGKHIGLPLIGCGIGGLDWEKVKNIIKRELKDMDVTIVIYNK